MGYPLIDEFCRVSSMDSCRPDFFRRCQREFRDIVQPQLDERDRLITEVAELREQLLRATKKTQRAEVAA